MLAYVFWHVPEAEVAEPAYEARLAAFHAALRAGGEAWLGETATVALASVPWLGGAAGYEDWYLVEDFEALGKLNAAAVSGERRAPHDAAASAAHSGIAGVMGLIAGPGLPAAPGWAAWLAKPPGLDYSDFHAELAAELPIDASAWQRQMVLGPATEYCVLAGAPLALPWPVTHSWTVRAAVPTAR
jgi:hypothetical protein